MSGPEVAPPEGWEGLEGTERAREEMPAGEKGPSGRTEKGDGRSSPRGRRALCADGAEERRDPRGVGAGLQLEAGGWKLSWDGPGWSSRARATPRPQPQPPAPRPPPTRTTTHPARRRAGNGFNRGRSSLLLPLPWPRRPLAEIARNPRQPVPAGPGQFAHPPGSHRRSSSTLSSCRLPDCTPWAPPPAAAAAVRRGEAQRDGAQLDGDSPAGRWGAAGGREGSEQPPSEGPRARERARGDGGGGGGANSRHWEGEGGQTTSGGGGELGRIHCGAQGGPRRDHAKKELLENLSDRIDKTKLDALSTKLIIIVNSRGKVTFLNRKGVEPSGSSPFAFPHNGRIHPGHAHSALPNRSRGCPDPSPSSSPRRPTPRPSPTAATLPPGRPRATTRAGTDHPRTPSGSLEPANLQSPRPLLGLSFILFLFTVLIESYAPRF